MPTPTGAIAGEDRRGSAAAAPPAIAKARLLSLVLAAAARARLSTTAVALLAHVVADAWWHDGRWVARTPQSRLATRLGVHRTTVMRTVQELHGIVAYHAGKGCRRSTWTIEACSVAAPVQHPVAAPMQPPDAAPTQHGRYTHAASNAAPMQRQEQVQVIQQQQQGAAAAAPRAAPAAAAAAAAGERGGEASIAEPPWRAARRKTLERRPWWVPPAQGWLDTDAIDELVQLEIDTDLVRRVFGDAQASHTTLDNVAAFVRRRLRRAAEKTADRRRAVHPPGSPYVR